MVRTRRYGPWAFWIVEDEATGNLNGGVYLEGYEKLNMVDEWSFAVDVDKSERLYVV